MQFFYDKIIFKQRQISVKNSFANLLKRAFIHNFFGVNRGCEVWKCPCPLKMVLIDAIEFFRNAQEWQ